MALALGALIAATMGSAVSAAPLCKDLKGLFTPCPQALNKTAQQKLEQRIETLPAERAAPGAVPMTRASVPHAASKSRFTQTKLCKDLKGLFTPCPR